MATYDDLMWAFMDSYVRPKTAAPVLGTIEPVEMPRFGAWHPPAVTAVTPALPTHTTPFPARALRHQRQMIGLLTARNTL